VGSASGWRVKSSAVDESDIIAAGHWASHWGNRGVWESISPKDGKLEMVHAKLQVPVVICWNYFLISKIIPK